MSRAPSRPIPLGPFLLEERIGGGGMGEVWRGVHVEQRIPVAAKVLLGHQARDPEFIAAFRSEVRAVAGLDHPGIIMVFEHGAVTPEAEQASQGRLVAGSPVLVMEMAGGGTLEDLGPHLTWPQLLPILRSLLDALGHAHAHGVIHRDIKRPNILVAAEDDLRPGIKVTDFGIAQLLGEQNTPALLADNILGSPAYMAPEQLEVRTRDFGPWTDLYAVGCLTWILATGAPPFLGRKFYDYLIAHTTQPVPEFLPASPMPKGLEAWLQVLLEKDPSDRFQRAADALAMLEEVASSPSPPAMRPKPAPLLEDWRRERPERSFHLVGAGLGLWGMRSIPLVGRVAERDQLWESLRRVHSGGKAEVVLLHGGAGHGKTRLAEWLGRRAHEAGAATILRCHHGPVEGPGQGLGATIARHLGCYGMPRAAIRARVETLLRGRGVTEPRAWEALTELMAPVDEGTGTGECAVLPVDDLELLQGDGPTVRLATPAERFVVIRRLLEYEARDRPVLLFMDDVQWGPEALAFAQHLLRWQKVKPIRVLVVAALRDDELAPDSPIRGRIKELMADGAAHLPLGPLPDAEHRRLVRDLLGLSGSLAKQVQARTRGNPMFAVQLVGDWVDRGVLAATRNGFTLRKGETATIPTDIADVWTRRLERVLARLPDESRDAVEIAAALGREVATWEWVEVCEAHGFRPPPALIEELERHQLATVHTSGWTFAHGMLRESVVGRAQRGRRWKRWNRRCAEVLPRLYPPTHRRLPERVGRHLLAAGEVDAAMEPLMEGARQKERESDYAMALRLLAIREQALLARGRGEEDERWAQGRALQADILRSMGRLDEAFEVADTIIDFARRKVWLSILPGVIRTRALCAWMEGEREQPIRHLQEALSLYRTARDPIGTARCLVSLAGVLNTVGRSDEAWTFADEARATFSAEGDRQGTADALRRMAGIARFHGRLDDAERLARKALITFERLGNRRGEAQAHGELGEVMRLRGGYDEAEEHYKSSREIFRDIGSRQTLTMDLNLTLLLLLRERWHAVDRAVVYLENTLPENSRGPQLLVTLCRLVLCAQRGDWAGFDAAMGDAEQLNPRGQMVDPDFAWPPEKAGRFAAAAGKPNRARTAYDMALGMYLALEDTDAQVRLWEALDGLPPDPIRGGQ